MRRNLLLRDKKSTNKGQTRRSDSHRAGSGHKAQHQELLHDVSTFLFFSFFGLVNASNTVTKTIKGGSIGPTTTTVRSRQKFSWQHCRPNPLRQNETTVFVGSRHLDCFTTRHPSHSLAVISLNFFFCQSPSRSHASCYQRYNSAG